MVGTAARGRAEIWPRLKQSEHDANESERGGARRGGAGRGAPGRQHSLQEAGGNNHGRDGCFTASLALGRITISLMMKTQWKRELEFPSA